MDTIVQLEVGSFPSWMTLVLTWAGVIEVDANWGNWKRYKPALDIIVCYIDDIGFEARWMIATCLILLTRYHLSNIYPGGRWELSSLSLFRTVGHVPHQHTMGLGFHTTRLPFPIHDHSRINFLFLFSYDPRHLSPPSPPPNPRGAGFRLNPWCLKFFLSLSLFSQFSPLPENQSSCIRIDSIRPFWNKYGSVRYRRLP